MDAPCFDTVNVIVSLHLLELLLPWHFPNTQYDSYILLFPLWKTVICMRLI